MKSLASPTSEMPDRSPLMSAANTGTPARAKPSAMHLQRDRLAGSGRAGDEAVAIGERQRQPGLLVSLADEDLVVGIAELVVLRASSLLSIVCRFRLLKLECTSSVV